MRKLTLSATLASALLASTVVASFAQTAPAPADGGMAGMQSMNGMNGMDSMQGMDGMQGMAPGGGAMPMGNNGMMPMGMMPMMMGMMPMMMMGGGSMSSARGASAAPQPDGQAGLETKLDLLIGSIETLTSRIDALEAQPAN